MKRKKNQISSIEQLTIQIYHTNGYFLKQVQKQVNAALTLRNWVIGYHIVEYEQQGKDRAAYGEKMLETLASKLKQKGLRGLAETNLKLFRQFYNSYPQIRQTVSDKSLSKKKGNDDAGINLPVARLLNTLSFSHFIERSKQMIC
jgi:hypothetical protein